LLLLLKKKQKKYNEMGKGRTRRLPKGGENEGQKRARRK
jgi:hypothetical protein